MKLATGERLWRRAGAPDCATTRRSTWWSPPRAFIRAAPANFCRGKPIRRQHGSSSPAGAAEDGAPGYIAGQSCSPEAMIPSSCTTSLSQADQRTIEMGPPRLYGHAGEYASADHALPRQCGGSTWKAARLPHSWAFDPAAK